MTAMIRKTNRKSTVSCSTTRSSSRAGIASIEFVMTLVPISILFMTLFWMAALSVNQNLATIQARHDAWSKRDLQPAQPFDMKTANQGAISGESELPIKLSRRFNHLIVPRSQHFVLAGAWQYPHVDLNRPPHYDRYRLLGMKAGTGKLAEFGRLADGAQNLGSNMQSMYSQQLNTARSTFDVEKTANDYKSEITKAADKMEAKKQKEFAKLEQQRAKSAAESRLAQEEIDQNITANNQKIVRQQSTIQQQESRMRMLNEQLAAEKAKANPSQERIKQLNKGIDETKKDLDRSTDMITETRKKIQRQRMQKASLQDQIRQEQEAAKSMQQDSKDADEHIDSLRDLLN